MDLEQTIDIDLRSDSESRMPKEMLKAMSQAKVGDDVFNDDPTAHQLQNTFARLFNKQAALFFPTTLMANTATVLNVCRPGQEIIVWAKSHVVQRQCSSLAMFGGVLTRQIHNNTGLFNSQQISKIIRKKQSQVTFPDTSLVFAQNPTFTGNIYDLQELRKIKKVCQQKKVHLHVDGARIFNAIQFYQCKPSDLSNTYDTMSISLNKGLCCPFGSILLGSKQFITNARVTRKSLGGGMRQIGVICAAGLYAIKNVIPQLKEDHEIALYFGNQLAKISNINVNVTNIQINMVHFNINIQNFPHQEYKKFMQQNYVKIKACSNQKSYRVVVYLQIRQKQVQKFVNLTRTFIQNIAKK